MRTHLLPLALAAVLVTASSTPAQIVTTGPATQKVAPAAPKYKLPDDLASIKVDPNTAIGRMVVSARKALAGLQKQEQIVALTPEFIGLQTKAARMLRDAEMLAAKSKKDRIAVAQTYAAATEQTLVRTQRRIHIDAGPIEVAFAEYAFAEAEHLLEEESKYFPIRACGYG